MDRHVKAEHVYFVKRCAKGMTLSKFKETFKTITDIDLDKAYVICGGEEPKTAGKSKKVKEELK